MRATLALVTLLVSAGAAGLATAQQAAAGGDVVASYRAFDTTALAVTAAMGQDLARVRAAEATYYAVNGRYTASAADLDLRTVDGTVITIEDADERSYRAVATNARLPGAQLEVVALAPPQGLAAAPKGRRVADSSSAGEQSEQSP
jgi:hypothetical protein